MKPFRHTNFLFHANCDFLADIADPPAAKTIMSKCHIIGSRDITFAASAPPTVLHTFETTAPRAARNGICTELNEHLD